MRQGFEPTKSPNKESINASGPSDVLEYSLGGFHHVGFYCGLLGYDLKVITDYNSETYQIHVSEEVII